MSTLYKMINPSVRWLLRSRLHGLMSKNTLLLEFEGRKSGRELSTPISYYEDDGVFRGFTERRFGWWRNLEYGRVHAIVRGRRYEVDVDLEQGEAEIREGLRSFLRAVPRDASHAGVALSADGTPLEEDIAKVAGKMVHVILHPRRAD